MSNKDNRQGVQSLEQGIAMLITLANAKEPLRLVEIAEASGMSRSKAHAYLTSLVRTGMASQDALTSRYSMGETALRIGVSALRRIDLFSIAREALIRLQRSIGETAFFTTWTNQGPMIVDKVDAAVESAYSLQMGVTLDLYSTSSGRLFMAYLPQAKWEHLTGAKQLAAKAATQKELENIRGSGVSIVKPVTLPGYTVLAAPVFNHNGIITAGIALAVPVCRSGDDTIRTAIQELRQAAARASDMMGAQVPAPGDPERLLR